MIRGVLSFLLSVASATSLLLLLAVLLLWAFSFQTSWQARVDLIGKRPGDRWGDWSLHVECGGAELTRWPTSGDHPTQEHIDWLVRNGRAPELAWSDRPAWKYPS